MTSRSPARGAAGPRPARAAPDTARAPSTASAMRRHDRSRHLLAAQREHDAHRLGRAEGQVVGRHPTADRPVGERQRPARPGCRPANNERNAAALDGAPSTSSPRSPAALPTQRPDAGPAHAATPPRGRPGSSQPGPAPIRRIPSIPSRPRPIDAVERSGARTALSPSGATPRRGSPGHRCASRSRRTPASAATCASKSRSRSAPVTTWATASNFSSPYSTSTSGCATRL